MDAHASAIHRLGVGTSPSVAPEAPEARAGMARVLRLSPFVALVLGVALFLPGVVVTADASEQERQQRVGLQHDAEQVAGVLGTHFERAHSLALLLAHDHVFAPEAGGELDREAANRALGYLSVLFPAAVDEACLIDDYGREVARVVRGEPAPASELSDDEADNEFFSATLALGTGEVHQSRPYVSPDTGNWVISNATWIPRPSGERLIVHFEVALESLASGLMTGGGGRHVAVVDGGTGQLLLRDGSALPATSSSTGFQVTDWSRRATSWSAASGATTIDGHPAAYRRIERTPGNANEWYVVEWSTARHSLVSQSAGVAGTAVGGLVVLLALVAMRRQQRAMRRAARLDHLTGIANRKGLEEALRRAVDAAASGGETFGVLMIDLDGFKQINDTLGHDRGDLVLQEVARRLEAFVSDDDTAARLGGDEFAVVLRHRQDADDLVAVAGHLRERLTQPIDLDGLPSLVGASVGLAVAPHHGRTATELLRAADTAMYVAKRDRLCVCIHDPGAVTTGRLRTRSTAV